ncbi:MAG TPA: hypothetical protein VEX68_15425 [Bryobacteraceae bacterium]|nr:hypothetical protein [Bryobacteraceae bacterium]
MTRRAVLFLTAARSAPSADPPIVVHVLHIIDSRAKLKPDQLSGFWSHIWPEAVRDFARCGIEIQSRSISGEVRRLPSGQPDFIGLESGVINFVITDHLPMEWDKGRALSGVTTLYRRHHLCVIALNFAHGHQAPFLSVNTCVHELLHVLLHDVFESRPKSFYGAAREFRVDLHATRLWLFHDGAAIRQAAQSYVERMRGKQG